MKKTKSFFTEPTYSYPFLFLISLFVIGISSCSSNNEEVLRLQEQVKELQTEVQKYKDEEAKVQANLALMQSADEAMNARDWDKFHETHTKDVYVKSPDTADPTTNVEDHYDAVKAMVDAFPDHKITLPYKARFGSGDWLCAIIEQGGTFTKPWKMANGQVVQPTGKAYNTTMVTVAKVRDGQLAEEFIIFDTGDIMRQIGLLKH